MPVLAPTIRQRFFDSNGTPLAGGLLYSYVAGSSTPLATYDENGAANLNPVQLDSEGYADVWLNGASYKLVLTAAGGDPASPIWSVDNVTSSAFQPNGFTGPIGQTTAYPGTFTTLTAGSLNAGLTTPFTVTLTDPGTTLTFLGDSRTANIVLDTYFPGKSYINKGVGGNTSLNVLARVDADIDETASRCVVLDIGVNDVVNGVAVATTEANITEIIGHLLTKGVRPVMATIAPTGDAGYNATIVTLNTWIKAYAALTGIAVVDYYAALVSAGTANPTLYNVDLIHPNASGYAITMPLALVAAKTIISPQAPPALWSGTARNWYFNSPEAIGTFLKFTSTFTNGRSWGIGHNFVNGGGEFEIYDYTAAKRRYGVDTSGNHRFGSANQIVFTDDALIEQLSAHGAEWHHGYNEEEITLSTSGTTTDSAANLLPANAIITAVTARVTTTITTATDWKLGDPTQAARFNNAVATLTAGTLAVGLNQMQPTVASSDLGPVQTVPAKVRITTTGTPGAGKIRVTVFYSQFIPPTS